MILFERGRIVDEYLSVPEFYGPLPPGDVIGLAANPTVVARLTGAAARMKVRQGWRTAPSPADLPPARELLAELSRSIGNRGCGDGMGGRARVGGLGEDRSRMKVLLLHGWPVSERDLGLAGNRASKRRRRCARAAPLRARPVHRRLGRAASARDRRAARHGRRVDGWVLRTCARSARTRAHRRDGACGVACGRGLVRAQEVATGADLRVARRCESTPLAEPDSDLEFLALAPEAMRDRLDLTGVAASFGGPLLVCVGDADELVTARESRELAELALDGTLEVFPGAGHFVAVDEPERFNEVLLEFVSQMEDVTLEELRGLPRRRRTRIARRPDST